MEALDATPRPIDELHPHACSRLKPPGEQGRCHAWQRDSGPENRAICIPDIDVLSQVQRARAIGPAVHSTFPRPKSAVPAAFDLLELNGQDTAPLFRKQARECRRLATLAQDSEEAPFGFVCPSTG
jgi:hypothetical protein